MTYKLTPDAQARSPLPGVPWRDLSDDEFAAVSAAYDAQFSPEQAGSLRRYFEPDTDTTDTSQARPPRARARREE